MSRLRSLVDGALDLGPVRHLRAILDAYGDAGGGLLAAGLAFGAVFALVPITLLIVGVSGFVVADESIRRSLLQELAARVPPLEEFVRLALDQMAQGAAGLSLVALLGLTWTSSQFYGQLDGAFALIFSNAPRRNLLERTVRGLIALTVAIALFLVLVAMSLVTTSPLPFLAVLEPVVKFASPLVALLVIASAISIVYRVVPNRPIPWRAVGPPALAVAIVEIALSTLFVALAPHLASPRFFGPFVALFASFAWLSWSFQVLLIGASWVRERADGGAVGSAAASAADGPG